VTAFRGTEGTNESKRDAWRWGGGGGNDSRQGDSGSGIRGRNPAGQPGWPARGRGGGMVRFVLPRDLPGFAVLRNAPRGLRRKAPLILRVRWLA